LTGLSLRLEGCLMSAVRDYYFKSPPSETKGQAMLREFLNTYSPLYFLYSYYLTPNLKQTRRTNEAFHCLTKLIGEKKHVNKN
jgi:hypothetical protein